MWRISFQNLRATWSLTLQLMNCCLPVTCRGRKCPDPLPPPPGRIGCTQQLHEMLEYRDDRPSRLIRGKASCSTDGQSSLEHLNGHPDSCVLPDFPLDASHRKVWQGATHSPCCLYIQEAGPTWLPRVSDAPSCVPGDRRRHPLLADCIRSHTKPVSCLALYACWQSCDIISPNIVDNILHVGEDIVEAEYLAEQILDAGRQCLMKMLTWETVADSCLSPSPKPVVHQGRALAA